MLVYSIASRNSFEMVQTVYDKILNYTGTDMVPCVIVGQKCDLHLQRCVRLPSELWARLAGRAWSVQPQARVRDRGSGQTLTCYFPSLVDKYQRQRVRRWRGR